MEVLNKEGRAPALRLGIFLQEKLIFRHLEQVRIVLEMLEPE